MELYHQYIIHHDTALHLNRDNFFMNLESIVTNTVLRYTASLQTMKLLVFQLFCDPFSINFVITTFFFKWPGTITYFTCYNLNCMLSFKHTLGMQKKTGRSSPIFLVVCYLMKLSITDYICIVSVLHTSILFP